MAALTERLGAMESFISDLTKMKSNLPKLKDSILSKSFSGSLVPQIASEGTGQDLLAKIKTDHQQSKEKKAAKDPSLPIKKKRTNK